MTIHAESPPYVEKPSAGEAKYKAKLDEQRREVGLCGIGSCLRTTNALLSMIRGRCVVFVSQVLDKLIESR